MAARRKESKKKFIAKTLLCGVVSACLYAAVFTHADLVMQFFTRGGVYAALPIATVFVFSFAHGAFAGNLWSALGIEAVTKQTTKRVEAPAARPQQRPRPRLRMTV